MSAERPASLQKDMFTGQLIDTRSQSQRQRDRETERPQQAEMFAAREILQFGVNPHPLMPIAPATHLELQIQDPRTDEEKERDLQRAAESLTYEMLSGEIENQENVEEIFEFNEEKAFYQSMIAFGFLYSIF